ncbi:MAG: DUF805 domain-containing protein [Candidatus Acidiferrales bacterium]
MANGRMARGSFFLWYFPNVLLGIVLKFDPVGSPWDSIVALLYLISLPVALVAAIRRSHDLGRSGWFALICLVPFAGWYLVFKPGSIEPNKYGPPPPSAQLNDATTPS